MKLFRLIFGILACMTATVAFADSYVSVVQATGGVRVVRFSIDSNGNTVVCPDYLPGWSSALLRCNGPQGAEGPVPLEKAVPAGKKLTGFQILKDNSIILYWK